jgi:hypothetical protein
MFGKADYAKSAKRAAGAKKLEDYPTSGWDDAMLGTISLLVDLEAFSMFSASR